ncbi:thioesterase domain-containing protein, partial [Klebsiella pneumoniae]
CAIDDALLPLLDRPFALVGASLGGMLAYELAARLDTREQQLEVLEQLLADKHISQSTYLAGQPVRQGYISS